MTRSHIGQSYQCVSVNAAAVVLAKCDPSGPSLVKLVNHRSNREFGGSGVYTRVQVHVQHCHNLNKTHHNNTSAQSRSMADASSVGYRRCWTPPSLTWQ